jgi:CspA family cold shock protein
MDGYKTLKAGQAVQFEKQPGDKGIHAVNICAVEQRAPEHVDHDEFISVEEPTISSSQSNEKTQSQATQNSKQRESVQ